METYDTPNESSATIRYSTEFNDEKADITYQSVDGVRFRIHIVYLKAHTEGLAPPEGSSLTEIVCLTESEFVLELLFRFIYPNRPPVLELEVEFDTVRGLAEAAEKYQVFPVMYVCSLYMHSVLPNHAMSILSFALKHDYPNLIDEAAPHVIDETIHNITQHIPPESHAAWFLYFDEWLKIQRRAVTTHLPPNASQTNIISSLAGSLSALQKLDTVFSSQPNSQWKTAIDNDIKAMTKLSRRAGHSTDIEPVRVEVPTQADARDNSIIIESSEGDQHYIDRATLQACATGFTDPLDSKIKVPEKSFIINLLLRFIKPARVPDLGSLPFEELRDLTYAVEKYSIKPATAICRVFMKKALPGHPIDIFHYAARHHYFDILDLAAPLVVGPTASFRERLAQLSPEWVVAWVHYYQKWQDVTKRVIDCAISNDAAYFSKDHTRRTYDSCGCGTNFLHGHLQSFINALLDDPGILRDANTTFSKFRCNSSVSSTVVFQNCSAEVAKLVKEIPAFSSLL